MDGFRLKIKSFSDPAEQNAYYQFHEEGTVVGIIVVYASDGCGIWYCINMPGSWHDSKIAWDLYDTLLDTNQTAAQYKLVADSGFRSKDGKLIITKKEKTTDEQTAACSIRQSAEHSKAGGGLVDSTLF